MLMKLHLSSGGNPISLRDVSESLIIPMPELLQANPSLASHAWEGGGGMNANTDHVDPIISPGSILHIPVRDAPKHSRDGGGLFFGGGDAIHKLQAKILQKITHLQKKKTHSSSNTIDTNTNTSHSLATTTTNGNSMTKICVSMDADDIDPRHVQQPTLQPTATKKLKPTPRDMSENRPKEHLDPKTSWHSTSTDNNINKQLTPLKKVTQWTTPDRKQKSSNNNTPQQTLPKTSGSNFPLDGSPASFSPVATSTKNQFQRIHKTCAPPPPQSTGSPSSTARGAGDRNGATVSSTKTTPRKTTTESAVTDRGVAHRSNHVGDGALLKESKVDSSISFNSMDNKDTSTYRTVNRRRLKQLQDKDDDDDAVYNPQTGKFEESFSKSTAADATTTTTTDKAGAGGKQVFSNNIQQQNHDDGGKDDEFMSPQEVERATMIAQNGEGSLLSSGTPVSMTPAIQRRSSFNKPLTVASIWNREDDGAQDKKVEAVRQKKEENRPPPFPPVADGRGPASKGRGKFSRRQTVCSDHIGEEELDNFTVDESMIVPKGDEVKAFLLNVLEDHELFCHLELPELEKLISAIDVIDHCDKGDILVDCDENYDDVQHRQQMRLQNKQRKHGQPYVDLGNTFFIVGSGEVGVTSCTNPTSMIHLGPGETLQETALLHPTPLRETLVALTGKIQKKKNVEQMNVDHIRVQNSGAPTVVYALNRHLYRMIISQSNKKKREMYEAFLSRIAFLKAAGLSKQEMLNLADALKTVEYQDGEHLINYGEDGKAFFLLLEGNVTVMGRENDPETGKRRSKKVFEFTESGSHFGELEFLHGHNCVADCVANGKVRAAKMNRRHFEMVMGPAKEMLKLNSAENEDYKYYRDVRKKENRRQSLFGDKSMSVMDASASSPATTKTPYKYGSFSDSEEEEEGRLTQKPAQRKTANNNRAPVRNEKVRSCC